MYKNSTTALAIDRTGGFMSPAAVAQALKGRANQIVHVVSYMQRAFAEYSRQSNNPLATPETDYIASHIAGNVHALHGQGIPTYALRSVQEQFDAQSGGLHRLALDPKFGDMVIDSPNLPSHTHASHFRSTALTQCMRENGKTIALIDGLYTHAAIFNLAADATVSRFGAVIVGDLCANGRYPDGAGEAATTYTAQKLARARTMNIGIARSTDITAALALK